jgi:hypothetical protein
VFEVTGHPPRSMAQFVYGARRAFTEHDVADTTEGKAPVPR